MSTELPPQAPPPPPPPPSGAAPPPPPPPPGVAGPVPNTAMLVLSYLGLLCLIPLIVEKEDREVQWHAKHGLIISCAEILLAIALAIITTLVSMAGGGCIQCIVWPAFMLAVLALHVLLIVKALNGQRLIIPYVSEYADRF